MYAAILVPVDLDEPSSWQKAMPVAQALADSFGARLDMVHVISDLVLAVEAEWTGLALRRITETADARLRNLAAEFCERGTISTHVVTGKVWRGVLETAEKTGADLIVMASHRPEMKDYLIGENAERVVRHAPCSVLVVRP